jgi:hypothetical protein
MPSNEKNPTYLLAEPEPIKQPHKKLDPAQRLLNFLQRWEKATVCTRDIMIFGPSCAKKREDAITAAEVLVRHGWLTPLQAHRRDRRVWRVVRRPLVHPTVEL